MQLLRSTAHIIDTLNDFVGRTVAWLTLGSVLVCFTVVILRYVFAIGFVWLQDLYIWQHACVFMLGAGYTFLKGGHVRVDLFYAKLNERRKAFVDLLGTVIFLFPWLVVLVWTSAPFLFSSWRVLEQSSQANGLPGYFLLKTTIWLFALLIALQGISTICRSILVLRQR